MNKSNSRNNHSLPKRTESHRIDSLAMRFIRTKLPVYWIDRDLSERDYGIDLAIEIFNKENNSIESEKSTGLLSLIQVKGTSIPLEEHDEYYKFPAFPVKTLNYALQFKIPFFLIVVSVNANSLQNSTAYFLWLQDYIKKEDNIFLKKNWQKKDTITLYIPKNNNFVTKQDFFEHCVEKDHFELEKLDAIRNYYLVKNYTQSLPNVDIKGVMTLWLNLLQSIEKLYFLKKGDIENDEDEITFDVNKIRRLCLRVQKRDSLTETQIKTLNNACESIESIISMNFDEIIDSCTIMNPQ